MFIIENTERWRVVRFAADGFVSFWNVYENERDAREHAAFNNRQSEDGSRWDAFALSYSDEMDVLSGRRDLAS